MTSYWKLWKNILFEPLKPINTTNRYVSLLENIHTRTKDKVSTRFVGFLLLLLVGIIGGLITGFLIVFGLIWIGLSYWLWFVICIIASVLTLIFSWLIWIIFGEGSVSNVLEWLTEDLDFVYNIYKKYWKDIIS